ncbi:MAG: M23 family metallopeptidase [Planctomycetes bacterium]|nr:M23 family metallopeptidase [Planctomycetota bacterium]
MEDYDAWGKSITVQADGIVIQTEDSKPDLEPGKPGGFSESNYVTVDYGDGIFGFYGHLQHGSLKVTVGDRVHTGQVLARVGNSGTREPRDSPTCISP